MRSDIMENFIKTYKQAQAIKRGFVPFDYDKYEECVRTMYAYSVSQGLLDSSDQTIRNALRMYSAL